MLDLAIVIVNYNTREKLRQCLQSVAASEGGRLSWEVVVVDNASDDGSAEMVRAEFPTVHVIASAVNGGYSYANNLGLMFAGFQPQRDEAPRSVATEGDLAPQSVRHRPRESAEPPRYALLLNPDTILPPTALQDMVDYLDARPAVGVAGPKLVRADGSLDLACRRSFPTPEISFYRIVGLSRLFPRSRRFGRYNMTYLDPDVETEVDSVVGAFMLVRRAAIEQVGLLDERFFMYGEDLDWALRIQRAGWKIYYNPRVTVFHHKRAASMGSSRAEYEFYRAMYLFYDKHYADDTASWLHWLVLAGIALKGGGRLAREIVQRQNGPVRVAA